MERKQLEMGLEFSFVDEIKHIKRQLALNMETISHAASKHVDRRNLVH